MELRRATPEDAAAIARVHVRAWRAGYRGILPGVLLDGLSAADREQTWNQLLSEPAPRQTTLVAVDDGDRIEGFCTAIRPSRDPRRRRGNG